MPQLSAVGPVLLGLALASVGAGCTQEQAGPVGSSPPSTLSPSAVATPTPPVEEDGPAAAYLAWLEALEARDAATACTIQHPELTIALRFEAILRQRAELGDPCVGFEALLWEDPLREYSPLGVETTTLTAEKATLAVDFPEGAVTVQLEHQRAAWRVLAEERRTPGTGDTDRWLDAWCDLSPGGTAAEVKARMGAPSGEYTVADGGEPQLWWAADQYDFRAYLDPVDGTVTDLVGDYDALSAADRDRVDCPELR